MWCNAREDILSYNVNAVDDIISLMETMMSARDVRCLLGLSIATMAMGEDEKFVILQIDWDLDVEAASEQAEGATR